MNPCTNFTRSNGRHESLSRCPSASLEALDCRSVPEPHLFGSAIGLDAHRMATWTASRIAFGIAYLGRSSAESRRLPSSWSPLLASTPWIPPHTGAWLSRDSYALFHPQDRRRDAALAHRCCLDITGSSGSKNPRRVPGQDRIVVSSTSQVADVSRCSPPFRAVYGATLLGNGSGRSRHQPPCLGHGLTSVPSPPHPVALSLPSTSAFRTWVVLKLPEVSAIRAP